MPQAIANNRDLAAVNAATDAAAAAAAAAQSTANNAIPLAQKGAASGVATLDGTTRIPVAQLPTTAELTTNKAQPNGYASLNGSSLVVQEPASATSALTANAIVKRDANSDILVPSTPTASNGATSKSYVDNFVQGLDVKGSVRATSTGVLSPYTFSSTNGGTLTATSNGIFNFAQIDGVIAGAGDRVLIKDEVALNAPYNGIYIFTSVGSGGTPWVLVRAPDANASALVTNGMFTFVAEGTLNANSRWALTTLDPIVLNTTNLSFTKISGLGQIVAGDGVDKTADTISASVSTATVEQQYGGLVKDRNSAGTGAAGADAGFLAVKTDNADLAIGTSNEVKIKALSRLDHVKGQATYAGSAPVYSELNALLPAQFDHGYFYKGATDSVFHAFRRSTSAGTIADFGIVEMA